MDIDMVVVPYDHSQRQIPNQQGPMIHTAEKISPVYMHILKEKTYKQDYVKLDDKIRDCNTGNPSYQPTVTPRIKRHQKH
jgi:hypothetical protein